MGLFRRNVTSTWVAGTTPPALDLAPFRLGGVTCGEPADPLTVLGPGEPGVLLDEYRFPAHGVAIEIVGGRLVWFAVFLVPDADDDMRPFAGPLRFGGVPIEPAELVLRLGEPDEAQPTADGWVLTFDADGTEWDVTLTADYRPTEVNVYGRRSGDDS